MQFNDWLQGKKAERKLSNAKIAAACEVSGSAVGKWLKGERLPERRQVAQLAVLFGVSPALIMRMTDSDALRDEIENGTSQQELTSLLAHVPEVEEFYRLLASMDVEKRAAMILIARAVAEGHSRG